MSKFAKYKRMMITIAVAIGANATLAACSSSAGRDVDKSKVTSYQPGVTSCSQIRSELGEPIETSREADGSTNLVYGKATTTIRGSTFIPIVGLFAGGADTKYDFVAIKCDPQGLFASYETKVGKVSSE